MLTISALDGRCLGGRTGHAADLSLLVAEATALSTGAVLELLAAAWTGF